jgi:hypothetical protein
MIRVHATLAGVGAELGVLVAENWARFAEFLQEAERCDVAFKRWQYVRGVRGTPGVAARIVGQLPTGVPYTGFEGYWAGSGDSPEDIIVDEVAMGEQLFEGIAQLAGVGHAWHAGLNIWQNPNAARLLDTALDGHYLLGAVQQLEPLFGALLARLRATAEKGREPEAYAAFQADVDAAVRLLTPSTYTDPTQHASLAQLVAAGRNVVGKDIGEEYELPRARLVNLSDTAVTLRGREWDGYRLLSEIGRMGHPLVRALLHISDWPSSGRLEFYAPLDDAHTPGDM